ncbi:MAG: hypothetical protein HYV97_01260 [Bdellovibrio sp.]|nr:hypothetical protein [Bdellovibrio sp.]
MERGLLPLNLMMGGMRLLLSLSFFFSTVWGSVDFTFVPVATSVEQSKALFNQRGEQVLKYWLQREQGEFSKKTIGFGVPALARIIAGEDTISLNHLILNPATTPYAKYGSSLSILGGLCQRNGDYDFMLQHLIRLAYVKKDSDVLWPQTRHKITHQLLTAKGNDHYRTFRLGICGVHEDSENHILMTETSRYLTNQLILDDGGEDASRNQYDNALNGFNHWMLNHLQGFFVDFFDEYNSRPYQGYTVLSLNNLHSFARDPKVRLKAEMLLDLLSGIFAVQSNGLRRSIPFRRQPLYQPVPQTYAADGETARFAMLAGNYTYMQKLEKPFIAPYGSHFMLSALVSDYRIPDLMLDLMIEKQHNPYFQKIRHQNVEIFSSSKNGLLSAGGLYRNRFDVGTKLSDGWARPTVLIATRDGYSDFRDWIHFKGHKKRLKRKNTCVAPGFACGLGPVIPSTIPSECTHKTGHWTFLNLNAPACSMVDYGLHVALYKKDCESLACKKAAQSFGFLEVREASELPFELFMAKILNSNQGRKFFSRGENIFTTSRGTNIRFEIAPAKENLWEIIAINGKMQERNFEKWPLFQGDILNSPKKGLITIDNPFLKQRMILDTTVPLQPRKKLVELQ